MRPIGTELVAVSRDVDNHELIRQLHQKIVLAREILEHLDGQSGTSQPFSPFGSHLQMPITVTDQTD